MTRSTAASPPSRQLAQIKGPWVFFVMGVRIRQWHRPDRWWPVLRQLRGIVQSLQNDPDSGLMHAEILWGQPTVTLQYWRDYASLIRFATGQGHMQAWKTFIASRAHAGALGVFHEMVQVEDGKFEGIYNHMPPFGAGAAGTLEPVTFSNYQSAARTAAGQAAKNPPPSS